MTCTGSCCACFPLSLEVDDLRANPDGYLDGPKLLDMLIPLSRDDAAAVRAREGGEPLDADRSYFTCRHWDRATRLCGIYDERPDMCRRFPYARGCEYGCDCVGEAAA